MSKRILITPRTFGKTDTAPLDMLREKGCELILNPFDRILTEEELLALIPEVDGLIVGLDPVTERVLEEGSRLKAISKYGVGVDNIDLECATRKGILVTNTPGTNSSAVAELAFGLMLDLARHISEADRMIRRGAWASHKGFELHGRILGIIGTGRTGKELALRAKGFNMVLICHDIEEDDRWAQDMKAIYLPLREVLKEADVVSLHVPLSEDTRHLISAPELEMMKETAILINTARGELVDEEALYQALKDGKLAGAGLDVWESEPPLETPLKKLNNVVLTSHIGAHTIEATQAMGRLASENLIEVLSGEIPELCINPEARRNWEK